MYNNSRYMPYEFRFIINGQIHFRGILESERCSATKDNGRKCKRICCMGTPLCFSHLLYFCHLKIQPSLIPDAGKGLFAIDPLTNERIRLFKKGDFIIEYGGEIIDIDELLDRYGNQHTAPYGVLINERRGIYEDGALRRGAGAFCNHATGNRVNARLSVGLNRILLVATKGIYNGDEIYINYGRLYQINEEGVDYETVKVK